MEKWKEIIGHEGLYEVSNFGRVRRLRKLGRKPRILKPINSRGYLCVHLSKNNIVSQPKVHKLVAVAFIGNIEEKMQVNHKDGNKKNNRIKNLEIVTSFENIQHRIKVLGIKHCFNAKLKKNQIRKIKILRNRGLSAPKIGILFGVSSTCIYRHTK